MVKVIAEIGSVHDGSFGNACCLIQKIAEAGAWAVKFQLHIAKEETTINAPNPNYFKSESRYDYFERTAFSENQWRELKEISHKNKCMVIYVPFRVLTHL